MSRDQADVAALYKHLRFAGVGILTLAEGEISELHVGLKGTMNALFLKDLAAKTHRGLRGRVEKGKSGGGLCYGYDVVEAVDAAGELIRGERRINETEAEIVRQIFREFASGASPRAIARRLNKDGIPGPSGKLWTDSALRGQAKRRTGLINNELYIGRLVWNRQRFVKNPETGRRVARINPTEDWIVTEVPELRIVDDELWQAAKARQGELSEKYATAIAVIEDGGYVRGMMDRLRDLEARQDELNARLSAVPADLSDIHPRIADIYRRKVERLAEALADPRDRDEAASAIRGLIERIVLTPGAKRGEMNATLHGDLGTILEWAAGGARTNRTDTPAQGMSVSVVTDGRQGANRPSPPLQGKRQRGSGIFRRDRQGVIVVRITACGASLRRLAAAWSGMFQPRPQPAMVAR